MDEKRNIRHKHIFLVGFMGAGKSYWGQTLATELQLTFVDLDDYIEQQEGMAITAIFKQKGEAFFRTIESKALREISSLATPIVLALGGGTPCFSNNSAIIKKCSVSFFLDIDQETLLQRLFKESAKRPLLHNKTKGELRSYIENKLSSRRLFYEQADFFIKAPIALESFLVELPQYL